MDKLAETGLTPLPASMIGAPLIAECLANLECRLAARVESGDHAILVGEIVAAWVDPTPKRLLCSVGTEAGHERLLSNGPWRFGVVKT